MLGRLGILEKGHMISQFLKIPHLHGQICSKKDLSVNYWNQSIRIAYCFSPNSMIVLKKILKFGIGNQMGDLSFLLMSCETSRRIFNFSDVYFSHLKMGTVYHAATEDYEHQIISSTQNYSLASKVLLKM